MDQVPRNFGDLCKEQQIPSILKSIMRMKKTFHNEKGKNRETQATDKLHQEEQGDIMTAHREKRCRKEIISGQDITSRMVEHHYEHCQHLQGTS